MVDYNPNLPGINASFGVMQGRLSRITEYGYQAFPGDGWEVEFRIASEVGFDHIEWVVDSSTLQSNPLLIDPQSIEEVVVSSGIVVPTVCGDFLMDTRLGLEESRAWALLADVLASMKEIGAKILVLPYVDQSSLCSPGVLREFESVAVRLEEFARAFGISVALETDLPPTRFGELLADLNPAVFGVNLDLGNSASLGYDLQDELSLYGSRVFLIHIKDRPLNGPSVRLGEGAANVCSAMRKFAEIEFQGIVTMQAFRDEEGRSVTLEQLFWLRSSLVAQ